MPEHTHVLLATLGGQPQVVTFTLDLLLQKGFPISEVMVIHPKASQPRLQRSLTRLSNEFVGNYFNEQRVIHFHSHVLQLDGEPIDDIIDDPHADGTLETLHKLIGSLKRQGYHIHLSVTGGRRLMSLLAISVAALNFDRHDHIWHIYTPEAVQDQAKDGRLMHVPPEAGVKLIQGQFIALGAYIYNESFHSAQQEQRAQMDANERARCIQVVKESTPSQRKVLEAFAQGLRPQQVAAQLSVELVTVHSHKTVLLRLCRNAWNISNDEHLDYHFLHTKFANYFEQP
ncbi:MAG TPA: CRISPR-associated ring nuclease [Ktedonobacteraceae bacterium]|nr:CRISPR-associated ring nuclease [Ktedonobacteraceae bacterium]